jgi:hypothetical protein
LGGRPPPWIFIKTKWATISHEITTTYYTGARSSKTLELLVSNPNFSQLLFCFLISEWPELRCLSKLSIKHCNRQLYFTKSLLFLLSQMLQYITAKLLPMYTFSCLNTAPFLNTWSPWFTWYVGNPKGQSWLSMAFCLHSTILTLSNSFLITHVK